MTTSSNKSIIVLGMHRSRTSLIAKILIELGVFMGNAFRKPDESNSCGYWEDLAWRNINKTLLNASGHTWWDPPPVGYNISSALHTDVHAMATGLSFHRIACYPVWGFKDPRTILTATYLHHAGIFPDPHYVIVRRSITGICNSLTERACLRGYWEPSLDFKGLAELYEEHLQAFLASSNNLKVHTIDSDDLMPAKRRIGLIGCQIERLAEFIGVQPPSDTQAFTQKVSGNKLSWTTEFEFDSKGFTVTAKET